MHAAAAAQQQAAASTTALAEAALRLAAAFLYIWPPEAEQLFAPGLCAALRAGATAAKAVAAGASGEPPSAGLAPAAARLLGMAAELFSLPSHQRPGPPKPVFALLSLPPAQQLQAARALLELAEVGCARAAAEAATAAAVWTPATRGLQQAQRSWRRRTPAWWWMSTLGCGT